MRSKQFLKTRAFPVLLTAAMATSLAACASKTDTSATTSSPTGKVSAEDKKFAANQPYELSLSTSIAGEPPAPGNEVEQAIQTYTGVTLKMQWIPAAAMKDKENIMIASGELPKAMVVNYDTPVLSAMRNGTFWELGPLLKDYPTLSKIDPSFYNNIKVDGKIYGIPKSRDIARNATIYRKDWLDALGLKEPKTPEDQYNIIKSFTLNDPDKNGKNDTIGYSINKDFTAFDKMVVIFGGPNRWGVVDGKVTPAWLTKANLDTLNWYKRLYDEKLMNQDFAVTEKATVDKNWASGKLGMVDAVVLAAGQSQGTAVKKNNPAALTDFFTTLDAGSGPRIDGASYNDGFVAIPKSSVKSEAEVRRILSFFEKMADPEMATLMNSGMEGIEYKVDNGLIVQTDADKFGKFIKPYRDGVTRDYYINPKATKDDPLVKKGSQAAKDNLKYAILNPFLSFNSPTYLEKGAELDQMVTDARVKYIMGKMDAAGFQQEMDKWLKAGGQKIIDEYTAEYAKTAKK